MATRITITVDNDNVTVDHGGNDTGEPSVAEIVDTIRGLDPGAVHDAVAARLDSIADDPVEAAIAVIADTIDQWADQWAGQ